MLEISNYGDSILHEITFSLPTEQNLVILGENGTGKTTLAKTLCGLRPSRSVHLYNSPLEQLSHQTRAELINYIPPKLDVFDEFITLEKYLHLSKLYADISVEEAMDILKITPLKTQFISSLSSGEQQLSLLANALLHGAKTTIFDEPTSNLDQEKTLIVFSLIQRHFGQKIVITHDLNFAHKLGFKILYLKNGRIAYFGNNTSFFEPSTLDGFFGSSIKKIDDFYVVNYQ